VQSENGSLTHFEVFTSLGFLLFSQENVDTATIEVSYGTSITALYDLSSLCSSLLNVKAGVGSNAVDITE